MAQAVGGQAESYNLPNSRDEVRMSGMPTEIQSGVQNTEWERLQGDRVLKICRENFWSIQLNPDQDYKEMTHVWGTMLKDYEKQYPEHTKVWKQYQSTTRIGQTAKNDLTSAVGKNKPQTKIQCQYNLTKLKNFPRGSDCFQVI